MQLIVLMTQSHTYVHTLAWKDFKDKIGKTMNHRIVYKIHPISLLVKTMYMSRMVTLGDGNRREESQGAAKSFPRVRNHVETVHYQIKMSVKEKHCSFTTGTCRDQQQGTPTALPQHLWHRKLAIILFVIVIIISIATLIKPC